jgi:hypothetical protein
MRKMRNAGKPERKDYFGDLSVHGTIKAKWPLRQQVQYVYT